MDDSCIDAIVTDPPYGLEFMGKEWDSFKPAKGKWADHEHVPTIVTEDDTPQHRAAVHQPSVLSRCRRCGGNSSGQWNRCGCDSPDFRKPLWPMRAYQEWCEEWAAECLRVLKPGGHMLAFGGTRTYHRLACAIEDAGFEIRDSIHWVYGSGFPKSLNVSKAIDKAAGAQRETVGSGHGRSGPSVAAHADIHGDDAYEWPGDYEITIPATDDAARWEGWGTALKPAHEPIIVARKPLAGTVAQNVVQHGTGALNVDGCRVATSAADAAAMERANTPGSGRMKAGGSPIGTFERSNPTGAMDTTAGRWPPNVVLTHLPECQPAGTRIVRSTGHHPAARGPGGVSTTGHSGQDDLTERKSGAEIVELWDCAEGCPVAELDRQSGVLHTQDPRTRYRPQDPAWSPSGTPRGTHKTRSQTTGGQEENGSGASRFFPVFRYQAKAPKKERPAVDGVKNHPTVKPLALMRWLVRLVTPPGGVVLDPFCGTGTTLEAARLEGFRSIGIDSDPDSIALSRWRLNLPDD
jgi:DNA modification methylase